MKKWSDRMRADGQRIALVPTMGFFHKGHLSLMKKARQVGDRVVVSLFVNPIQFGPTEDLEAYPRDLAHDTDLAEKTGVDVLFTPDQQSLYPEGFETYIAQENLPEHLCGLSRPGHFRGVMTIVAKLLHIVNPHFAVFGEKDFQQLAVIQRMAKDLDFDIEIIGQPIFREPDGLAMSSRNVGLTTGQRASALSLFKALKHCRGQVRRGETDSRRLIDAAEQIIHSHPETAVDYIAVCDPVTLNDAVTITGSVLMALAVKVGNVRLIDNMVLAPEED